MLKNMSQLSLLVAWFSTMLLESEHLLCQTQSIGESMPLQVFLQAIHHCGTAALRYA